MEMSLEDMGRLRARNRTKCCATGSDDCGEADVDGLERFGSESSAPMAPTLASNPSAHFGTNFGSSGPQPAFVAEGGLGGLKIGLLEVTTPPVTLPPLRPSPPAVARTGSALWRGGSDSGCYVATLHSLERGLQTEFTP